MPQHCFAASPGFQTGHFPWAKPPAASSIAWRSPGVTTPRQEGVGRTTPLISSHSIPNPFLHIWGSVLRMSFTLLPQL